MTDARHSVVLHRDTHLFASRPELTDLLQKVRRRVRLAPDELLHPEPDTAYLVRLGRLRVSEFLPDGREITRAVLQAGALFVIARASEIAPDAEADVYDLGHIVLMALGEAELWAVPPKNLDL